MVNQKAISAKIDIAVWDELEREVQLGYDSRNRIINKALRYYLEFRDTSRKIRCIGNAGDREGLAIAWLDRWMPHARPAKR